MADDIDKIIADADKVYQGIKGDLEKTYSGMIVAIDPKTGDYFVGKTSLEACGKGRAKYPDTMFVCKRVGAKATYFVGAI